MSRRILLVVDSLFLLGDAYQLKVLIEGLAGQHEVAIGVAGPASDHDRNRFTTFDIPIHFLASDQKLKHRSGMVKFQTALRLRKRIRAFQPDIVHTFGQTSTQIAAAALSRNNKTKLYSSILSKWQPQTTLTQWFERSLLGRVDRFIVAHECLRNELLAFDIPEQKFSVVANGISESSVANNDRHHSRKLLTEATGLEPSAFIAVTSADLEPVTRLKDLIWATDLLLCVRDDVHLVILGKGSQIQRLRTFAACTLAEKHIHFADLPATGLDMLGGADVYWNSHLQSPLPSGVLAAMSFGVPVISVYGPETSPLIKHQETGFAVNYGARDEFARWTKFLIEKPDAAKQLALQGQSHVQRHFVSNQMVSEIEKIYS